MPRSSRQRSSTVPGHRIGLRGQNSERGEPLIRSAFRDACANGRCSQAGVDGYRGDESIAASRESLNVPRLLGVIAERGANLIHAEIDATLKVHGCVVSPEATLDFVTRDNLS